jgi:nitric oxide reductase NorQ protein
MDRLITIKVDHYDRETEIQITLAKSGVPRSDAEAIVDIIRGLRAVGVNNHRPTIRAGIAIARVMHNLKVNARAHDATFRWICRDILNVDTVKVKHDGETIMPTMVDEMIGKICGQPAEPAKRRRAGSVVVMEGENS